jgi:hypothetical protein
MKFSTMISGALIWSLCFAGQLTNRASGRPEEVTYCQIVKDPSSFFGERKRVRAIYSYMFEISRFKPPACCPDPDVSIWVDFSEEMGKSSKKLLHKFPEGTGFVLATFEGTLQGGGHYGHGQYPFQFTVDRIERLEKKANPSLHHFADWIPKCEASNAAPPKQ